MHDNGLILIMGLNMRTEIHLLGQWNPAELSCQQMIDFLKNDYAKYGKQMSEFRKNSLEHWDLFVNPYQNIRAATMQLAKDLDALDLNPESEKVNNPTTHIEYQNIKEKWTSLMERYHRGVGLALGIKIMTPILAEAFINLVIYLLCKPDIKSNIRLYESIIRANIDIKVQSLHVNCIGFKRPIDWASAACSKYNGIVNERNDLLHGNVCIDKLKFQDIYFKGTVPVFTEYRTMWQQSIGVAINASGLNEVKSGLQIIRDFESYIMSCMDDNIQTELKMIINKRDLGLNRSTSRVGILFPDYLVDFAVTLKDQ